LISVRASAPRGGGIWLTRRSIRWICWDRAAGRRRGEVQFLGDREEGANTSNHGDLER
jgi:hypothetical protein